MCAGRRLSGSWAQLGTQGTTWHYTGSPWHRLAARQPTSANPGLLPSFRQLGTPRPLAERGSSPYIHPWPSQGAGEGVGQAVGGVGGWEGGWMSRWEANLSMNGKLYIFIRESDRFKLNVLFIILHLCSKTSIGFPHSTKVSSICPSSPSS